MSKSPRSKQTEKFPFSNSKHEGRNVENDMLEEKIS